MRFEDIPQFTSEGNWKCTYPMKRIPQNIEEWIKEDGLQMNPGFQRGHVWTEEQQIRFVEYLLKGGKSARVVYFNHPGWMRNFEGDFVCVDGLQRVTAVIRFMNNEIPAFGHYLREYEDKVPSDAYLEFCVNDLKTREEVLDWYLQLNTGGTVHTSEELEKVRRMLAEERAK